MQQSEFINKASIQFKLCKTTGSIRLKWIRRYNRYNVRVLRLIMNLKTERMIYKQSNFK
jgi:hypothetical protein